MRDPEPPTVDALAERVRSMTVNPFAKPYANRAERRAAERANRRKGR